LTNIENSSHSVVFTGVVESIHSPGAILELIRLYAILLGQKAVFSWLLGVSGGHPLHARKN
jgi:hypothetical protein